MTSVEIVHNLFQNEVLETNFWHVYREAMLAGNDKVICFLDMTDDIDGFYSLLCPLLLCPSNVMKCGPDDTVPVAVTRKSAPKAQAVAKKIIDMGCVLGVFPTMNGVPWLGLHSFPSFGPDLLAVKDYVRIFPITNGLHLSFLQKESLHNFLTSVPARVEAVSYALSEFKDSDIQDMVEWPVYSTMFLELDGYFDMLNRCLKEVMVDESQMYIELNVLYDAFTKLCVKERVHLPRLTLDEFVRMVYNFAFFSCEWQCVALKDTDSRKGLLMRVIRVQM